MDTIIEKSNLKVLEKKTPSFDEILTDDALMFAEAIENKFGERRRDLLEEREKRQIEIDNGLLPDFLSETAQNSLELLGRGCLFD